MAWGATLSKEAVELIKEGYSVYEITVSNEHDNTVSQLFYDALPSGFEIDEKDFKMGPA